MDAQSSHAGSFKAASEVSEGGKQQSLSPEQKDLLIKSRIVMFLLLIVFVACSLFEIARIIMCILLLGLMGILSCNWEEDSYLATNDGGSLRRVQTIACQALMILFPLGTSGWMAYICYLFVNPEPGLPFTDTQLNAFATPPLLQE